MMDADEEAGGGFKRFMATADRVLKILVLLFVGCALLKVLIDVRRPYAIEAVGLELYCPTHQDTTECWLYSHLGLVYAPQQQSAQSCPDPSWHFVGYNSDGRGQCCRAGSHWDGPDTGRCTQDAGQ